MKKVVEKLSTLWQVSTLIKPPKPRKPSRRMLHLGVMAATLAAQQTANIDLTSHMDLTSQLKKYTKNGCLKINKLSPCQIDQVRAALESTTGLVSQSHSQLGLIMDTGCSKIATPHKEDFIPGSLTPLSTPMGMEGIAGTVVATHKGRV